MITEMRDQGYLVEELCVAFDVSKSGYYSSLHEHSTPRKLENERLVARIKEVHSDRHRHCYGSPRMTTELNEMGYRCSPKRVARLMRENGIAARHKTAFKPKTTVQDSKLRPSPNRLSTAPEPQSPGKIYVSDITYVATREGWLYLAVILDLYSRKVVGWDLDDHMEATLVTNALDRAVSTQPPAKGAIFHSDRGSQYSSSTLRKRLPLYKFKQSMSAKGYCYDNAKNESFFASLKRECFPDNCCFDSKAEARLRIFDYLETFYNRHRRHSTLNNLSPDAFLARHYTNQYSILN